MHIRNNGFSLVELAVVITIIGVIIGGILVGRDMIRSSEIRAAIDESQHYTQALNNFRDKYGELPGDFSAATSHWPAAHADLNTCKVTVTDDLRTCNGDGDGWITEQPDNKTYYEQFRAWQHLKLAGMIVQRVTPITGANGTQDRRVGYNIPTSKLNGAGWGLMGLPIEWVTVTYTSFITHNANDVPPGHVLILGGNALSGHEDLPFQQNVFSGREAQKLDTKIDDGNAQTGRVVVQKHPTELTPADYTATSDDIAWTLVFKTGL